MQQQTVIEGIAQLFGTTPTRFTVFFLLACGVAIWAIVVAAINLSAHVPSPEGRREPAPPVTPWRVEDWYPLGLVGLIVALISLWVFFVRQVR